MNNIKVNNKKRNTSKNTRINKTTKNTTMVRKYGETNSSGVARKTDEQRVQERMQRRKLAAMRKKQKLIKRWMYIISFLIISLACILVWKLFLEKSPIDKGTELLKDGQYKEAIMKFEEGLSNLEYLEDAYRGIGLSYYELEDYSEAAKSFELAIQKGLNNSGVLYNLLSISYIKIEEYDSALDNIVLAIQQSGNSDELNQQLRFNEVLCMEKTGDWDGAKAKATSYLQSFPEDTNMGAEIKFLESR